MSSNKHKRALLDMHAPGANQCSAHSSALSQQVCVAGASVPRSNNKSHQCNALLQQGPRSRSKCPWVIHAPITSDRAPAANDQLIHAPAANPSSYSRSRRKDTRSCGKGASNKANIFNSLECISGNVYFRFTAGSFYLLVFNIADFVFWFTKARLVRKRANEQPKQNSKNIKKPTIRVPGTAKRTSFVTNIRNYNDKSHAPLTKHIGGRSVIQNQSDNFLLQERGSTIGVTRDFIINILYHGVQNVIGLRLQQ